MGNSLFQTLNISRQDLLNRMNDLDTISTNMANMNTAGFRASRLNFQELFTSQKLEGGTLNSSQFLTTGGTLESSDSSLDWAIQGDGFFPVKLSNGEIGYTRDGVFSLDANNQLVNSSGYILDWDGQIPEDVTEVDIREDGLVTATLDDGTAETIGTVQLARFANPTALISAGSNIWVPGDASGEAAMSTPGEDGCGTIESYTYEASNVSLSEEMTRLIQVQRSFQMSAKVLSQTDTMIGQAINMRKA